MIPMNEVIMVECCETPRCQKYDCKRYGAQRVTRRNLEVPMWCDVVEKLVFMELLRDPQDEIMILEKEGIMQGEL